MKNMEEVQGAKWEDKSKVTWRKESGIFQKGINNWKSVVWKGGKIEKNISKEIMYQVWGKENNGRKK